MSIRKFVSGVAVLGIAAGVYYAAPEQVETMAANAGASSAPLADEVRERGTSFSFEKFSADTREFVAPITGWFDSASTTVAAGVDALPSVPQAAHADPSDHAFLTEQDGEPVRWNPCEPIHYVVNDAQAEPGAVEDVKEAFAQIHEATGLEFVFDGETDEVPTLDWYAKEWSGRDYAPLAVAWATDSETDFLSSPDESGRATANKVTVNGSSRLVTGAVVLNSDHNDLYRPGFGEGATRGTLLLHEIGHAVGLGHAEGEDQIMHPEIGSFTPGAFAAGDLAGLEALGAENGCNR